MKTKLKESSKAQRLIAVLLTMAMALGIGVFYVSAEGDPVIDTAILPQGSNGAYDGDKDIAFEIVDNTLKIKANYYFDDQTSFSESDIPSAVASVYGHCSLPGYNDFFGFNYNFMTTGKVFLNGEELESTPFTSDNPKWYLQFSIGRKGAPAGYYKMFKILELTITPGIEITEDFFNTNQLVFENYDSDGNVTGTLSVGTYVEPQPAKDGIEVLWDGASVGTVSYEDMLADISETEDITYTGYNNKNNYKTYSGKVYTLDQLLAAVGKDNDWNAATDTATLTLNVNNESKSFTKGVLTPARYTYDENGNRGTSVPVGFIKQANKEFFKFAYGQIEPKEKNVPLFWDLAVKEEEGTETPISAQISINTSTSPSLQLTSSLDSLNTESTPTLTVENGEEGYQYEFKVINEGTNAWWTIQKSSSENSCKWYAGPGPGNKVVYAFVKDANGKDVAIKELRVKVEEQTSDTDLTFVDNSFTSSVPLDKLTASSNTTLSVKATGGEAPYQYRFRVNKNGTDTWYTIKGFDEKDNCTWWAGPAAGAKTIYVDVKDAKGDIARMVVPVIVGESALKVDSITSSIPNLKASDITTLEAEVSGAEGDVTCQFKIKNLKTGKEWWVPASDIDGNTCKWYAGPEAAQKTVTVYVKDAAGNTANGTLEVNVA